MGRDGDGVGLLESQRGMREDEKVQTGYRKQVYNVNMFTIEHPKRLVASILSKYDVGILPQSK